MTKNKKEQIRFLVFSFLSVKKITSGSILHGNYENFEHAKKIFFKHKEARGNEGIVEMWEGKNITQKVIEMYEDPIEKIRKNTLNLIADLLIKKHWDGSVKELAADLLDDWNCRITGCNNDFDVNICWGKLDTYLCDRCYKELIELKDKENE